MLDAFGRTIKPGDYVLYTTKYRDKATINIVLVDEVRTYVPATEDRLASLETRNLFPGIMTQAIPAVDNQPKSSITGRYVRRARWYDRKAKEHIDGWRPMNGRRRRVFGNPRQSSIINLADIPLVVIGVFLFMETV